MKKIIKASASSKAARVHEIIDTLIQEGCDKEEIFEYFLDRLTSDEAIDILKDYADTCGVNLEGDIEGKTAICGSDFDPYDWYYSLPGAEQGKVEQIAEEWGLPDDPDEWTLSEMDSLMEAYDNLG